MRAKLRFSPLLFVFTLLLLSSASAVFGQVLSEKDDLAIATASNDSKVIPAPTNETVANYLPNPSVNKRITRGTLPAASPTGEDEWKMQITPYAWIPQLEGNLRVRETIVRVDASASSLVGMLDFVAAAHFEATKRKYGFFLDDYYVNLGTEGVRPSGNITQVEPSMNIFEAGAMYAPIIIHNDNGSSSEPLPPKFSLEILGGMRVFYMKIGIDPTNLAAVEGSRTIVDAFAGNRVNFRPTPRFTLSGKYTLGGGGSHFAWSGNLMADYRFRRNLSFNGGYQVLDINADKASNTVGFNGRLRGMIFGLTLYR